MRLLFTSTAGDGHLGPLLPLAGECQRQGHAVWVSAPARAAAKVEARGLSFRPFDDGDAGERGAVFAQVQEEDDVEAANVMVVREVFGRIGAVAAYASVRALIDELRPDLVVREPFEGASWLAAADAGVPSVLVPCASARSLRFASRHLLAGVTPLLETLDLRLPPSPTQGAVTVISSMPAALDPDWDHAARLLRAEWATDRLDPPDPPPARPLAFACFGTVAGSQPGALDRIAPAIFDALASLEVDLILATGRGVDTAALGEPPPNVCLRDHVPFGEVLPRTSVALTHGGFGTTLGVIAAGVPSVGMPLFAYDQWMNTEAVARAGAGLMLDLPDQTPEHIAGAIAQLLADEQTRSRARTVAEEMAGHVPLTAIPAELEALVS